MRKIENMKCWPELLRQKDSRTLHQLSETYGGTPAAIAAALRRHEAQSVVDTDSDADLPPEAGEELRDSFPQTSEGPERSETAAEPSLSAAAISRLHPEAMAADPLSPGRSPSPTPATSVGRAAAWKLILGRDDALDNLVVGTSLVEAAEAAMRTRSDVLGLTYMGEIIGGESRGTPN